MQGSNYQLDKESLLNIPIYIPTPEQSLKVEQLVDQIIMFRQNNEDSSALENEIDILVFDFYKLNEREIKIIFQCVTA